MLPLLHTRDGRQVVKGCDSFSHDRDRQRQQWWCGKIDARQQESKRGRTCVRSQSECDADRGSEVRHIDNPSLIACELKDAVGILINERVGPATE